VGKKTGGKIAGGAAGGATAALSSGVLGGAEAGSVGGPVGVAVGAVIGGALGYLSSVLSPDKKKLGQKRRAAFESVGGVIRQGKYFFDSKRIGYRQARRISTAALPTATKPSDPGYRPDLTERRLPPLKKRPPATPPPPPPTPPSSGGPTNRRFPSGGTIRGQIVAYVVANGVVWAITKTGEWIRKRNATLEEIRTGTVGGGPRRGGARGQIPAKLEPIRITARRLPMPKRQTLPVKTVGGKLEPIVITAQRLPMPAPVTTRPTWAQLAVKLAPSLLPSLSSLLKTGKANAARRQLSQALTALNTLGVGSSSNVSSYFSGGYSPPRSSKTCECKPKKKRKKKEPRQVCYGGTYRETATGLVKQKRRKIPCQSSSKK